MQDVRHFDLQDIWEHLWKDAIDCRQFCCWLQETARHSVKGKLSKPMLILIAGPYRSGTNDDPVLMQKNVEEM
jgi:hypothetical protein